MYGVWDFLSVNNTNGGFWLDDDTQLLKVREIIETIFPMKGAKKIIQNVLWR